MTVATYKDTLNQSALSTVQELQPNGGVGGGGGGDLIDTTMLSTTTSAAQVEQKLTEIQQFYDRCSVFITGGTGFLGKSEYFYMFIMGIVSSGGCFR